MTEQPELVPNPQMKSEPFHYKCYYKCSVCRRPFVPPEDRGPQEAMDEVLEAFREHIREEHSGEGVHRVTPLPELRQTPWTLPIEYPEQLRR